MMKPLLEACPTFVPTWTAFEAEWSGHPEGLPIYLALGDLARHLVDMLARGDTAAFPKVFAVIEEWHTQGDAYVREAATAGCLENLQNTNIHKSTNPEQFREFLGPLSVKWWEKLYGFWERGELLKE